MDVNKKLNNFLHIFLVIFISIFILFTGSSIAHAQASSTANNESINSWMPNPKFQNLILDNMKTQGILGQNSTVNDITKENMAKLKWVDNYYYTNNLQVRHQFDLLSDKHGVGSYSIEGLQYAKNIISLQLTNVSDVTNDGQQIIGDNSGRQILRGDITDVSPLANLTNLKYVWLNGNRIVDVSPLVHLQNNSNIKYLNLFANSIYDFSGLDKNKYTATSAEIHNKANLGGVPSIGVTGLNDGKLIALEIDQQFATLNPVTVSDKDRSYRLDINKLVKLPNNEKINNVSVPDRIISVKENNVDPIFLFAHFNCTMYGAKYNNEGNGIVQYNNLATQHEVIPATLINDNYYPYNRNLDSNLWFIFNHNPEYQNYMTVMSDDGSIYSVPYLLENTSIPIQQNGSVTINYVDDKGNKIADSNSISGSIGSKYSTNAKNINGYSLTKTPTNATGTYTKDNISVNYVYSKNENKPSVQNGSVTINYVDDKGNKIADSNSISGDIGSKYSTNAKNINGYSLTKTPTNAAGTYTKDNISVNYVYSKNGNTNNNHVEPVPQNNHNSNVPNNNNVDVPSSINNSNVIAPNTNFNNSNSNVVAPNTNSNKNANKSCNCKCPTKVVYIYVDKNESKKLSKKYKGLAVYALRRINMYKQLYANQHKLNAKNNIVTNYIRKPRIKAPMFVVNKVIKLTNGKIYYRVQDVNNKAKTEHLRGYITANRKYVTKVYYAHKPAIFTVINPQGVDNTRRVDLTDIIRTFPQGTMLKFKKIAKYHLTTRYVLSNGTYVTGNRKLIQLGKHYQVKKVRTKKNIYLYRNINLTQKKKLIKKNTLIKVRYYDYSYRYNFHKTGSKVYLVHGGYISANKHNLKIVK